MNNNGFGDGQRCDDLINSEALDAYAVAEGLDPSLAVGSGDLSLHEVATDPATNLAYLAYYNAGMRVVRYSRAGGVEEMGAYIDADGSNFWGVEQFTDEAGNRLIAGSDRDFGLQIFKYNGPGAVLAPPPKVTLPPETPTPSASPSPSPSPAPTATPTPTPGPAVAKRIASFFRFGSLARLTFVKRRASVSLRLPSPGRISASVRARIGGRLTQIASATPTTTAAGDARLTFTLSAANARRLSRTLSSRRSRATRGVLRATFTPTGGTRRTRDGAVSIRMG